MDSGDRISECIRQLQSQLEKYARVPLKEAQTRLTFINPLLTALGWDVADPEQVDNEHATVDGKAVDYALKANGKVVLLVEAKALGDPLTDVKAITQVVGYASNEGIEWCALTNGAMYKIYCSTEKASAPDKLVFEVSIDPNSAGYTSLDNAAGQLKQISRGAMEAGMLRQVYVRIKVEKALDNLLADPPPNLVSVVRAATGDGSIGSGQVKEAIKGLRPPGGSILPPRRPDAVQGVRVAESPRNAVWGLQLLSRIVLWLPCYVTSPHFGGNDMVFHPASQSLGRICTSLLLQRLDHPISQVSLGLECDSYRP